MGYKRISAMYFLADTIEDLKKLPKSRMGAECFVIAEACEYKCNSANEWIRQTPKAGSSDEGSSGGDSGSGSIPSLENYATKEYVKSAIDEAKAYVEDNFVKLDESGDLVVDGGGAPEA